MPEFIGGRVRLPNGRYMSKAMYLEETAARAPENPNAFQYDDYVDPVDEVAFKLNQLTDGVDRLGRDFREHVSAHSPRKGKVWPRETQPKPPSPVDLPTLGVIEEDDSE